METVTVRKRGRGRPLSPITTFYLLVVTQTLSLVGSRMTSVGLGIWLFATTGNTTPLLLAAFFNELAPMLGGGLAGVLVDRWNRRRVLLLADTGQAAGTLLLLASFLSGRFELWHLYLVVFLQGAFAALQQPARDASTTLLVPDGRRERANAIKEMAFPLAGVAAPVLAGLLYAAAGVQGIIAVDLVTFIIAVVAVAMVAIPQPAATGEGAQDRGSVWQEMQGAIRFLRLRRPLLLLLLYGTVTNFLLNGPLGLAIPFLLTATGSETLLGGLLGLSSLGALAGAGLLALWGGTRPRIHTLMPGMLLTGSMFLLLAIGRSPLLLGAALFLLFAPLPIGNALVFSLLQLKAPPDMQGRLFALNAQLGYVGATLSFLLVGPLVDRLLEPAVGRGGWHWVAPFVGAAPGSGMRLLLLLTGLLLLAVTAAVYALPIVRRMELELPDYEAAVEAGAG